MLHSSRRHATLFAILMLSATAAAHHSYAMFDGSRELDADAVVARLEWRNPHVFVWLYVPHATSGEHNLLALETDSTNLLTRQGWTRDSLVAGQRIRVSWYPLRDGRAGGHLIRVTTSDGRMLSGGVGPITGIRESARRARP